MTVGIVTTVGTYYHHLPQWAASIKALHRQPDEVVIAASEPWRVWVSLEDMGVDLPGLRVLAVDGPFLLSRFLNAAITAAESDWIAWIGVDDAYRPEALTGLDDCPADVLVFGMQIDGKGVWHGGLLTDSALYNPIPCGSPFRRALWQRNPFNEDLAPYEDWAFWIAAHHAGARAMPSGRVDFDYRLHDEQIQHDDATATRRIHEWARQLSESGSPPSTGPSSSTA